MLPFYRNRIVATILSICFPKVLFVPPSSSAGRIVGVTPADNPQVGHLVMVRLAGGAVELANVAVVAKQVSADHRSA